MIVHVAAALLDYPCTSTKAQPKNSESSLQRPEDPEEYEAGLWHPHRYISLSLVGIPLHTSIDSGDWPIFYPATEASLCLSLETEGAPSLCASCYSPN